MYKQITDVELSYQEYLKPFNCVQIKLLVLERNTLNYLTEFWLV